MNRQLNSQIQLIVLQFSLARQMTILDSIYQKPSESAQELVNRKSATAKGEQFLAPVENVSALSILADFSEAGCKLVGAYWQPRTKNGKQSYMARFTFAAPGHIEFSEGFLKHKDTASQALSKLLSEAMWRIRGFVNPLFKNQELVEDAYALSINLEGRQPIINEEGKPILQWQRDSQGNKVGECKAPLQPEKFLRIVNGDICVIS